MTAPDAALRIAQESRYEGKDWWRWSVWVEGPDSVLDAIEEVTYTLHPSFSQPVRTVTDRASKFRLDSSGWGRFRLYASVTFRDGQSQELEHDLELYYPEGQGPASREGAAAGSGSASRPTTGGSVNRRPSSATRSYRSAAVGGATAAAAPSKDVAPLKLFISHRQCQNAEVTALRNELAALAGPRLEVVISMDLRDRLDGLAAIEEALRQAELLAIIYTARGDEPDWPLYDWAYFRAYHRQDSRQTLLLRPADVVFPSASFDGDVCLTSRSELTSRLVRLLTRELRPGEPPIMSCEALTDDRLTRLVDTAMAAASHGEGVSVNLAMRIVVSIDAKDVPRLENGVLPDSARVTGDPNALEVIGLRDLSRNGLLWSEFREVLMNLTDAGSPTVSWVDHLGRVLASVIRWDSSSQAGLPLFQSPLKKRVYRPVVSTYVQSSDGSMRIVVLFTELPPELDAWPPGDLGAVTHILTLTRLFRWGVLAPFSARFVELQARGVIGGEAQRALRDLDIAINNLTADAFNRGLNLENVRRAMADGTQGELDALIETWMEAANDLEQVKESTTVDPGAVLPILREMGEINRRYFELFGERQLELLRQTLRDEKMPLPS